ncbi:MAG: LysM peptidoglycan-binding domain-containing protein, partial [Cyclobacteriaceae bacterium]|nr:LysM peptidoglycan-binding domain-containing protein [Cyclobacteriaceae bacterium]
GNKIEGKKVKSKMVFQSVYKPISDFNFNENQDYPKINNSTSTNVKINGIPGFIASSSEDLNFVLAEYGISKSKFYKYNDMTSADKINGGYVYYLKAKKSKAKIHYHVVIPGENAWSISQKYGVKLKKLLSKNRMKVEKDLSPGMVMWLRFIRPASVPVEYKKTDAKNVIIKSIPNETEHPEPK